MPRHDEIVRQWSILQTIEAARAGVTLDDLARQHDVTRRTIYRDLDALQRAGFSLYDDREDGRVRWKLSRQPLKGLETAFTLSELCALYFSRTLLECLAGTPFQQDLARAFERLARALPPKMRQFLDRLPAAVGVKREPARKRDEARARETIALLLEATLEKRQATMRYHSLSSRRVKDYVVHPYRVAYAQGGLYLFGYVPEYAQVRTFAVERIKRLSLADSHFELVEGLTDEVFAHSLGVHQGAPVRIEVEFNARVAPYIKERIWHASQKVRERADGSIRMELHVCDDWALRSWILGFGPFARVVSPSSLAEQILEDLDEARTQYAPRLDFELPRALFDVSAQMRLPGLPPSTYDSIPARRP